MKIPLMLNNQAKRLGTGALLHIRNTVFCALAPVALLCSAVVAHAQMQYQETFESTAVGAFPTGMHTSNAGSANIYEAVSSPTRAGSRALRVKLQYVNASSFRAEVVPNWPTNGFLDGTEYWVGISQYLKDWAPDAVEEMLLQGHRAFDEAYEPECGAGPNNISIRASGSSNHFKVSNQTGIDCITDNNSANPNTTVWSGSLGSNQWVDWVINFKMDASPANPTGFYKVWRNGVLVHESYNIKNATNKWNKCCMVIPVDSQHYYLKLGIYKPNWKNVAPIAGAPTSREMFLDEVRIWAGSGGSYNAVAPGGGGGGSAPTAPASLTATATSSTNVDLVWPDVANETLYRLERKTGAGTFGALTTTTADSISHSDATVVPGTTYTYQVRAENSYGYSSWTASTPVTPGGGTSTTYEAELQTVAASSVVTPAMPNNIVDAGASNAEYSLLNGTAAGYFVEYTITGVSAGTYSVKTGISKRDNRGIYQLKIDGANQGAAQDYYFTGTTALFEERDLGNVTLTAGSHSFRFDCTGKNASGTGFKQGLDYIKLTSAGGSGPDVNVTGNSVQIADGDTSPQTGDNTDFGSADITSGTIQKVFNIQNTGTATLSSIVVTTTNSEFGLLPPAPPATIAAGGNANFTVAFNPTATGLRTATLNIASNDADENPYNFSIQGTGTAVPEINVQGNATTIADGDTTPSTPDHTDFGSADITSGTVSRTYTIQNTGSAALTVGTVTAGGDFSITTQPAASVAAAGSTTFVVLFNPSATGLRTATLSFSNGDVDENPYNFSIQGTGTSSTTATFYPATESEDGRLKESTETSNVGGSTNPTGPNDIQVGDESADEQLKAIVSFDTSSLPDTATIISATLRLKRAGLSGSNPFTWGGQCNVDIRNGGFNGNVALEAADFQAAASATNVAQMSNPAANGDWSAGALNASGVAQINKTGKTQLRISFTTDDNNNNTIDRINFSGAAAAAGSKPELVIVYQ